MAEAAPYSIEVVEPKVPLVQNGSINLRVVAKRAEGFKGAITVYPLWTPPGLGIQGSAVIPERQTESAAADERRPERRRAEVEDGRQRRRRRGQGAGVGVEPAVHASRWPRRS